jgi:nucleoside-diphosphate-sugar epimerase
MTAKRILVAGAGGFIGGHLVNLLETQGHEVVAVDVKPLESWYQTPQLSKPHQLDLSLKESALQATAGTEWVFNLACNMGGMGFIENNKALCMESVLINTHLLQAAKVNHVKRYFFASSACVYAATHQDTLSMEPLKESDAYPAAPEDGYGWEKLFSERMCRHFSEDYGLEVRVARYHNVYGPLGTYQGGREKAPAAASRKVAELVMGKADNLEIWGDGKQLRSFTYIDDCLTGTMKLMESSFSQPLNIGSSETVSVQQLYDLILEFEGLSKSEVNFKYLLDAPQGVRGRSSNNNLCNEVLNWAPSTPLKTGLRSTYDWVKGQISLGNQNS